MHVECWQSLDGTETTLCPPEHLKRELLDPRAQFQYAIYADTWTECMIIHHILQGWAAYEPFDED